jgi:twinkle protein
MSEEILPRSKCPDCDKNGGDTSENGLAHYADGGTYCFKCGTTKGKYSNGLELIAGVLADLSSRGINRETCEKYRVREKLFSGYINKELPQVTDELVYIFPYTENGNVVAQKISHSKIKTFGARGKKSKKLWGQDKFSPDKRWSLIITEGEFDAMSCYQMFGSPSVSLPDGASCAVKVISENMEWLSQWKEVLLCFDNDKVGRDAVEKCLPLFEPGTVRNITLPLKDANDMLKAGRIDEFKKAVWNAEKIKPRSVVSFLDIVDQLCVQVEWGSPWPWKYMDLVTYGIRKKEVTLISADTGIGKTFWAYNVVANWLMSSQACAHFDLERSTQESGQRSLGLLMGEPIHLPDYVGFDQERIRKKAEEIGDSMHMYDVSSGLLDLESVLSSMRYLRKAHNVTLFVIDNLLALASYIGGNGAAHEFASRAIGRVKQVTNELDVHTIVLNHVIKDISGGDDNNWQTGRLPTIDHIYGGKATAALADNLLVAARDVQNPDPSIREILLIQPLKSKFHSKHTGKVYRNKLDKNTGRLIECSGVDNPSQS